MSGSKDDFNCPALRGSVLSLSSAVHVRSLSFGSPKPVSRAVRRASPCGTSPVVKAFLNAGRESLGHASPKVERPPGHIGEVPEVLEKSRGLVIWSRLPRGDEPIHFCPKVAFSSASDCKYFRRFSASSRSRRAFSCARFSASFLFRVSATISARARI